MVKDYGRSEEIAQDVFVSALRRMRNSDSEIAFKPWIYEIAKNACIDQFRRGRRAELVSYDADEALGETDRGRLVTTTPSPDAAVDQKQSLDHLCGAFGGLSEAHHDILVMRELEGLSYREIGERLGMSRASVESTLFRARKRLSEEYDELVSGERCLRVQAIISATAERSLGARDQRRMARHVSYCQPCRRHAALAGLDVAALTAKPALSTKIAAVLPLPAFLRRHFDLPGGGRDAVASSPNVTSLAQWSAQMAPAMDPAGMATWAKAAVAAATVAIAGVGANAAREQLDGAPSPDAQKPSVTRQAEQRGADGVVGAGSALQTGDPQAPAAGGDGTAAPIARTGEPVRGPGTRTNSGKAPANGSPTRTVDSPNGGGPSNSGPFAPPAPYTQPPPTLGDTTKGLLAPPPGVMPGTRPEGTRREGERGPIGSTIESATSTLLAPLFPGQTPAPTGPAPATTAPSQAPAMPGLFPADSASARAGDGGLGAVTDGVRQVVGSLVAP